MENTNETAEPSGASAGSQPVGWGAVAADGSVVCMMRRREHVASCVVEGTPIVPLYRSPTLTDEEREAIDDAAEDAEIEADHRRREGEKVWASHYDDKARSLRAIIERLK